jgi:hypothetical protein
MYVHLHSLNSDITGLNPAPYINMYVHVYIGVCLCVYVYIIFAFMLTGAGGVRCLSPSKRPYLVSRQDTETWEIEGPWPYQPAVPLRQMLIFM